VVVAGWSGVSRFPTVVHVTTSPPDPARSLDMDDIRRLRDREHAAPLGRVASGRLVIGPRAAQLAVRGDPSMADLYRASFESPVPAVKVQRGTVTLRYPRTAWRTDLRALFGPPPSGQVTLNASIPWHIRVRGGTAGTSFGLGGLILYALELGGGASQVEMVLPTPAGTVPVRVAGGVHHLTVLRPAGVAARVRVGHGARRLTLDGQHVGATGGSTSWHSPDYQHSTDRYDIAVRGGADTLTLHTS
jgi:hypothetical protein